MADETLDALLRVPKQVQVGAKTYALKPFGILAVPVFSRLADGIWQELMDRPDLLANQQALMGWLLLKLPGLIETRIEDLLALMAMQTGATRTELVDLPLDDFYDLAQACFADAQDFFMRRVMPRLTAMLASPASGIGPTPLPDSSPTAIAATAS